MATTNPRDEFIKLRKSGVDPTTARTQAYGEVTPPIQNAPVAGQAPAITPMPETPTAPEATTTPVNVNEQQRIDNQAKRQEQIVSGQVPAVGQTETPVTLVAPTPAPTPVTPTPAPTTPAVDKTAEIKAKNEGQLAIKKQQADLRQTERDKATQEANNQLASSETAILNTLRTGGIIPESVKTSPFYKSAQQTYNKLQQFSTYSTSDLTTALNNGALLPGTSVYNEMLKDPAMKQKLTQAQMYTVGTPVDTNQVFTAVSTEILSNNPTTAGYLDDGIITLDEYNNATNNEAIVAKAKEVEEKTNKYNTLNADYEAIPDLVRAQFPGSPFADSIIADRQKAMYRNLVLAKGEVDTATGTLTELKSQASNLFETNLKLYESRRAEQVTRENAVFEANLGLQTKQKEAQMAQEVAREAMNDPYVAIPQMIAQYAEMGIPFTRSVQQVIQDFEGSGQDLATYLTGLQKLIQEKPEYQAMQAFNMKQLAPPTQAPTTPYELKEVGGKTYKFNQQTGQYEVIDPLTMGSAGDIRYLADQFPGQAWAKNNNPAGITWNANFEKGTGTAKLLADAGIQFTKGTARPANEGGNYVTFATIEDGLKAQRIIMAQTYGNLTVGDMLAKWVGTSEGPNYAKQVARNAGIDTNVKVSSLTEDQLGKLQMAKIQKESPGLGKILQGTGTQVSPDAQNYFNLIQKGTTSYEDVFKKLGGSKVGQALMNEINSLISAQGGAIPAKPDSEPVKKMDDLIGRLDDLLKDEGNKLEAVSGLTYGSLWDKSFGYDKQQALGNLKFVLKGNTLQQLIDAKAQGATFGALSNEELRMLQESASPLLAFAEEDNGNIKGFKIDEATLKEEVRKLRDLFKEKREKMVNPGLSNQGIMTLGQTMPTQPQTSTGVGQTYQGYTIKGL